MHALLSINCVIINCFYQYKIRITHVPPRNKNSTIRWDALTHCPLNPALNKISLRNSER